MARQMEITLHLGDLTARTGEVHTVFRCSREDKDDLDRAAHLLKMSSAQFIRMVVLQAARKVVMAEVVQ
jgi:uncharacterized protein (DUF1778 family)